MLYNAVIFTMCRYSEGVTDIQASSVTLAGPPKDVFTTCGVNKPPTV